MEVYIILTMITCLSLFIMQQLNRKYTFLIGGVRLQSPQTQGDFMVTFIILSVFSLIRDNVGCDYNSYLIHVQKIQRGMPHYMEIGFQWICKLVAGINDNPRIVIIIFAVATCYFYLRAIWDQSDDIFFSVFIFLTWGYYFMTFNTVRNYFALSLTLFSIKHLAKKEYFRFVFIVVIAALFHKSALVCIPIYVAALKKYKLKDIAFFAGIVGTGIVFKGQIQALIFQFYPSYEGSAYDSGRISYLNVIKALLVLSLCVFFWKKIKDDKMSRVYFNLNLFALILYTAFYWIPEISRIGFYMNATTIFLLPRLVQRVGRINRQSIKILIYTFSIILFLLLLNTFQSETTRLLPYKTWLLDGSFNQYPPPW